MFCCGSSTLFLSLASSSVTSILFICRFIHLTFPSCPSHSYPLSSLLRLPLLTPSSAPLIPSHSHTQSLSPLPSPALHISLPRPTHHPSFPPSLNWESGRAVEIALTRALPGCAIHLLFYYAAPGLPGLCRSICHRPRSLITGICHRLASLLMLSSPP